MEVYRMQDSITPFEREIQRAARHIRLAAISLADVKNAYSRHDMQEAYRQAFTFSLRMEKLALLARSMPALTGRKDASRDMKRHILSAMPIVLGYTDEGWFYADIPALLPKKEHGGPQYIRESLYLALREFFRDREQPLFDDCVLVVCHQYRCDRPERRLRDHDNIELNAVVDALALYVLRDDAPLACQHHYCSIAGERDATLVYLMPAVSFLEWYRQWLQARISGLNIPENSPKTIRHSDSKSPAANDAG